MKDLIPVCIIELSELFIIVLLADGKLEPLFPPRECCWNHGIPGCASVHPSINLFPHQLSSDSIAGIDKGVGLGLGEDR